MVNRCRSRIHVLNKYMLEIITYPNDILKRKSHPVNNVDDPKIKKLISDMVTTLDAHDGIGLAAPQVGESLRLCVLRNDDDILILVNPEIKKLSGKKTVMEEGCLSFPGRFIPVMRHSKIKVKSLDAKGNKQIIRAKGLLARALQHEIDHLDGVLFIERPHE